MCFHEIAELSEAAILQVQERVRRRVLKAFVRWVDAGHEQLRYHLPKPLADGTAELVLPALELLERLSAFIPPPRIHRHRYFRVLAPNARLRPAVAALASRQALADSDPATSSSARIRRACRPTASRMVSPRVPIGFGPLPRLGRAGLPPP